MAMGDEELGKVLSSSMHVTVVQAIEDYDDDDLKGSETVPTIELTEDAELCDLECQANDQLDEDVAFECGSLDAPVAVPLGSLLSTGGMANEFNSTSRRFQQRPEFISAAVIKPRKRTDLGLSVSDLVGGGSGLCISEIKRKGLFFESGAPLEVGDRVVSINNQSCDGMDFKQAAKILRESPSSVTIVVQNVGGDPLMVECMITKPTPDHRTGIGFSASTSPPRVNISAIFPEGLFADSLLTEGDEVLNVNSIPCRELESETVADIIITAPKYVTVLAKKFEGNGVVVACDGSPKKRKRRSSSSSRRGNRSEQRRRRRLIGPGCQLVFLSLFIGSAIVVVLFFVASPLASKEQEPRIRSVEGADP